MTIKPRVISASGKDVTGTSPFSSERKNNNNSSSSSKKKNKSSSKKKNNTSRRSSSSSGRSKSSSGPRVIDKYGNDVTGISVWDDRRRNPKQSKSNNNNQSVSPFAKAGAPTQQEQQLEQARQNAINRVNRKFENVDVPQETINSYMAAYMAEELGADPGEIINTYQESNKYQKEAREKVKKQMEELRKREQEHGIHTSKERNKATEQYLYEQELGYDGAYDRYVQNIKQTDEYKAAHPDFLRDTKENISNFVSDVGEKLDEYDERVSKYIPERSQVEKDRQEMHQNRMASNPAYAKAYQKRQQNLQSAPESIQNISNISTDLYNSLYDYIEEKPVTSAVTAGSMYLGGWALGAGTKLAAVGTRAGLASSGARVATFSPKLGKVVSSTGKMVEPAVAGGSIGVMGYDLANTEKEDMPKKLVEYAIMGAGAAKGWKAISNISGPKIPYRITSNKPPTEDILLKTHLPVSNAPTSAPKQYTIPTLESAPKGLPSGKMEPGKLPGNVPKLEPNTYIGREVEPGIAEAYFKINQNQLMTMKQNTKFNPENFLQKVKTDYGDFRIAEPVEIGALPKTSNGFLKLSEPKSKFELSFKIEKIKHEDIVPADITLKPRGKVQEGNVVEGVAREVKLIEGMKATEASGPEYMDLARPVQYAKIKQTFPENIQPLTRNPESVHTPIGELHRTPGGIQVKTKTREPLKINLDDLLSVEYAKIQKSELMTIMNGKVSSKGKTRGMSASKSKNSAKQEHDAFIDSKNIPKYVSKYTMIPVLSMQQFYENTQQHDQVLMSRLVTESATSTTTEEMLEQITKQETTTRIPTKEKFRKRPLVIPPVYARLPESKKNNKKKINKTKIESDMVENTVQMSSLSDLI
jgi:hypothetical protein